MSFLSRILFGSSNVTLLTKSPRMLSTRLIGSSSEMKVSEVIKRILQQTPEGKEALNFEKFKASLGKPLGPPEVIKLLSFEEFVDINFRPFDEWKSRYPEYSLKEAEEIYAYGAVSRYKIYLRKKLTANDPGTAV